MTLTIGIILFINIAPFLGVFLASADKEITTCNIAQNNGRTIISISLLIKLFGFPSTPKCIAISLGNTL